MSYWLDVKEKNERDAVLLMAGFTSSMYHQLEPFERSAFIKFFVNYLVEMKDEIFEDADDFIYALKDKHQERLTKVDKNE